MGKSPAASHGQTVLNMNMWNYVEDVWKQNINSNMEHINKPCDVGNISSQIFIDSFFTPC